METLMLWVQSIRFWMRSVWALPTQLGRAYRRGCSAPVPIQTARVPVGDWHTTAVNENHRESMYACMYVYIYIITYIYINIYIYINGIVFGFQMLSGSVFWGILGSAVGAVDGYTYGDKHPNTPTTMVTRPTYCCNCTPQQHFTWNHGFWAYQVAFGMRQQGRKPPAVCWLPQRTLKS